MKIIYRISGLYGLATEESVEDLIDEDDEMC